jgi:hypothetical protein
LLAAGMGWDAVTSSGVPLDSLAAPWARAEVVVGTERCRPRAPATMTPLERRREVAALFARAYARVQIRRNRLAGSESGEAECARASTEAPRDGSSASAAQGTDR